MELEKNDCPPEDVLFEEILARLEVESLIRLKLVSKRWLHLITTDSRFISNHFRRQSETPAELSIILPWDSDIMFVLDHRSGTTRARDVWLSCVDRFPGSYSLLELVGSCNGLVCVVVRGNRYEDDDRETSVMLWNPATGEARDTLAPPVRDYGEPDYSQPDCGFGYGFGYDERHQDYKVVRIRSDGPIYDNDSDDSVYVSPPPTLSFYVFSRNIGVWRRLERNLVARGLCRSNGILVNGCLYWCFVQTWPLRILSFDLCSDEFRVIDTGICFEYIPQHEERLVRWKHNCLAYITSPMTEPDIKFKLVVVLDGDGNVAVDHAENRTSEALFSPGPIRSLYGVSHGRFFVEQLDRDPPCYAKFMMYDLVSDRGSLLSVSAYRDGHRFSTGGELHDYVPTLISVYPDRNIPIGGR